MSGVVRIAHGAGAAYAREAGAELELLDRAPWLGGTPTGVRAPAAGARLLSPCEPTKIVGIGRNYAEHARELGNEVPKEPMFFLKPPSAVIGPGAPIERPRSSTDVQHEAELGLVIGKRARRVSEADALAHVFGITAVNDVTARDVQRATKHFTHAKGFDGFCPIGPRIVPGVPAGPLAVRCRVNGATRQDGSTRDLVFGLARLVAFVSSVMTLEPGDVISTGTPAGVGPLVAGDVVAVEVEGVGVLENPVVDERA